MDKQIQKVRSEPDYHRIYSDLIARKYPEKQEAIKILLQKKILSILDIIKIDQIISKNVKKENVIFNQQHRSYDLATIEHILSYSNIHKLNNSQVAKHFKLSRNTIAKWKKIDL